MSLPLLSTSALARAFDRGSGQVERAMTVLAMCLTGCEKAPNCPSGFLANNGGNCIQVLTEDNEPETVETDTETTETDTETTDTETTETGVGTETKVPPDFTVEVTRDASAALIAKGYPWLTSATISPGPAGVVEYSFHDGPDEVVGFQVTQEEYEGLFDIALENDLFRDTWTPNPLNTIGVKLHVSIVADGTTYRIPWDLVLGEQRSARSALYQAVWELKPDFEP